MATATENDSYSDPTGFTPVIKQITATAPLPIKSRGGKAFVLFLAANASILLSMAIISGGGLVALFPYVIAAGCTFPFLSLWFSRWRAKHAHQMYIIDEKNFQSTDEQSLYELVESLCRKAGLSKTPQIGIYSSNEAYAFATGASRNSSLIAFSSRLLEKMDERAIAAVAAHEVAHLANGDMVALAIVQSVVNSVVLLITLPLRLIGLLIGWLASRDSRFIAWLSVIVSYLISIFIVFLGSLLTKAFSRRREYKADHLAARLLDKESMIRALEYLRHEKPVVVREQKAYAAFKINSPGSWLILLSTHPTVERRIQALEKLDIRQEMSSI